MFDDHHENFNLYNGELHVNYSLSLEFRESLFLLSQYNVSFKHSFYYIKKNIIYISNLLFVLLSTLLSWGKSLRVILKSKIKFLLKFKIKLMF